MLPSVLLVLFVLTAVSSQPQSFKYHISSYTTRGAKEFYKFDRSIAETFPEAQRLCALYGGHITEPKDHYDRESLSFLGSYWINTYFDEQTATWRWLSDDSAVRTYFVYGVVNPKCKGDDCSNYRQYVSHFTKPLGSYYSNIYQYKFYTTDVTGEKPIVNGIACERPVAMPLM
ncbi:hypothetical protein HDE_13622 [Halotydeus destructor]|nr:hypothetical protein HDE_13622 [Halotydeus destructor]